MSKPKLEKRFMEMRAADGGDDQSMIIEGRAICYNSPQTYTYGEYSYTEVIQPGALDKTDMKDVPLRYNHNDSYLIMARTRNKSLELIRDEKGLMIRAELLDTQSNRDVYQAIKEGLLDKMSFAFTSRADTDLWEQQGDDTKRTITDIEKLYDVILDAVGSSETVNKMLPLLKRNGTIGVYGWNDRQRYGINPFTAQRSFNVYNDGYDEEETNEQVQAMVLSGVLKADLWYNMDHPVSLSDIADVYEHLRRHEAFKYLISLN